MSDADKHVLGIILRWFTVIIIILGVIAGVFFALDADQRKRDAYDQQCYSIGGLPAHGILGDRCDTP